jgi:cytochrome c-type biogenesis protein
VLQIPIDFINLLNDVFIWLNSLISETIWIALIGSFLWGVLSILLSPCHLSSIPLIIAYISRKEINSVKKSFRLSLLFAIGILLSLVIIGLITTLLGRIIGDIGDAANYILPVILIFAGLILLDILNLRFIEKNIIPSKIISGSFGVLTLGVIAGIGLGPCTFAFAAPILAIMFNTASTGLFYPILLLLSFSIGHCMVISLAGVLTKKVQSMLNLSEKGKPFWIIKKTSGVLMIILAGYLILIL